MARIQVLELGHVETQIEDLSYDTIGIIRGGLFDAFEAYRCVIELWRDIFSAGSQEEIIQAQIDFVDCLDAII